MLRLTGWLTLLSVISGSCMQALNVSLGNDRYGGLFYIGHNIGTALGIALSHLLFGLIFTLAARYLFTSKKTRRTYSGLVSGIVGIALFTTFQVIGVTH